jgi:hypothetical protein
MHSGRFISPPIRLGLGSEGLNFDRADIEIYGIDQSGPSFEGRIFLNNPKATAETPPTVENGYAGSFHVYGYGIWPDDVGKDRATREAESRNKIRAPIVKTVIATDAIRVATARSPEVTVTVVPVYSGNPPRDAGDALKLEEVRIVLH